MAGGEASDAYSYASKSARGHVLQQRKIGRQSFIAIEGVSDLKALDRKGGV
jgi:hypothetical protein